MKTATIRSIDKVREYQGPHGTVYYYTLELDNGEVGELGKKKPNAFNIGDALTYTSEESPYGLKFKEVQQNGFNGRGFQKGSTASFALAYAKDIAVANIAKADKPLEMHAVAAKIIETATEFNRWLKENE
jgi:hypothetical protein